MLQPGHSIAGHQVGTQLGGGPLAATYTIASASGAPVGVLRMLLVRLGDFRNRFLAAAEVLRGLHHPNLVQIFDVVEVDGRVGVITEYVGGGNLTDWIKAGNRSADQVVPMFCRIARGVAAAHDGGLLHRNLKPSKVLIGADQQPRIAGFALGKITLPDAESNTEIGTTFGTPQYMPPEQFRGVADVDERADLFALGCILYEMLSGKRAFEGADLLEMYRNVLASDIDPLPYGVPAGLVGLVADLLDPDRERRPPTVQALFDRMIEDAELRPWVESALQAPTIDSDAWSLGSLPDPEPLVDPEPAVEAEPVTEPLEAAPSPHLSAASAARRLPAPPEAGAGPPAEVVHPEPAPLPGASAAHDSEETDPELEATLQGDPPQMIVPPPVPSGIHASTVPRAASPPATLVPPAPAAAAAAAPAAAVAPPAPRPARGAAGPTASVHPRRRGGAPSLPPPRTRGGTSISLAQDPAAHGYPVIAARPHPFDSPPEPFPQWAKVAMIVSALALMAAIATVILAVVVTM